jgi:DNA-binding transcriptional MocR family regulator
VAREIVVLTNPTAGKGRGTRIAETTAARLRQAAPRLAYLIPDFHNPTAAVMDDRTREVLSRELRRSDTLAVVDESLREVNLDDVDLPPSAYAS